MRTKPTVISAALVAKAWRRKPLRVRQKLDAVTRENIREVRAILKKDPSPQATLLALDAVIRLLTYANQMSAAGIITLPGMMTGQILAGMAPIEAAKYQILVLFLLAGGAGLGAMAATYLAVWRITDERDRLRLDRLAGR